MLVQGLIDFFSVVGIFVGIGIAIDMIVDEKERHKVSWYVFGFADSDYRAFETGVIRALLSPFILNGRIDAIRVVIYSLAMSTLFMFLVSYTSVFHHFLPVSLLAAAGDAKPIIDNFWLNYVLIFVGVVVVYGVPTALIDWMSFQVTKRIFVDLNPKAPLSFLMIAVDIFLSVLTYAILFAVLFKYAGSLSLLDFDNIAWTIYLCLLVGSFSAVLVSAVQLSSMIVGAVLRGVLIFTRINRIFVWHTKIADFPFMFVFFLLGMIMFVLSAIFGSTPPSIPPPSV